MKIKLWIGVLLCMLLSVSMLPTMAFAADEAGTGDGTAVEVSVQAANKVSTWDGTVDTSWYVGHEDDTVYNIDSAAKLAGLSKLAEDTIETNENGEPVLDQYGTPKIKEYGNYFKGKTLILTTDIDLDNITWTPINTFSGTFKGGGHTINNMYIEQKTAGSGFFDELKDATVEGLVFKNAEVVVPETNTHLYHGILAGVAKNASIKDCGVTGKNCGGKGSITDKLGIVTGGLIGLCYDRPTLQNCWSFADIDTTNATAGGLVGQWDDARTGAQIIDCYFGGTINVEGGDNPASGIIGLAAPLSSIKISGCVSYGEITTPGLNTKETEDDPAHIVMFIDEGSTTIENCMWPDDKKAGVVRTTLEIDVTPDGEFIFYLIVDTNFDDSVCGQGVKDFEEPSIIETLNEHAQTPKLWALSKYGYPVFREQTYLVRGDYSKVAKALQSVQKESSLYTEDTWNSLETTIKDIDYQLSEDEQAEIYKIAKDIEAAIAALEYKDADYTAVDAAIDKADGLIRKNYIDFTGVDDAIAAVVRDKDITEQAAVDKMAKDIEDAIVALVLKDAVYTEVNKAIEKANDLDRTMCKDFSGVDAAIKAVVRGKNITEQTAVDEMAEAINAAIEEWEKATEHTSSDVWEKDKDKHWKVCTVCKAELNITVHEFGEIIEDKPPTCTETGIGHKECAVCGHIEIFEIEAKGHDFGKIQTYAATCVTDGYTYHVCNVCKFSEKVEDIKATGHKESDWM